MLPGSLSVGDKHDGLRESLVWDAGEEDSQTPVSNGLCWKGKGLETAGAHVFRRSAFLSFSAVNPGFTTYISSFPYATVRGKKIN